MADKKNKKRSLCLIKSSEALRKELLKKISDKGLTYGDIIEDAKEKGITMTKAALSRYLVKPWPNSGGLTQEAILWLAVRNGIGVNLIVAHIETIEIEIDGKKQKVFRKSTKVPTEEECIAKLKKLWGKA